MRLFLSFCLLLAFSTAGLAQSKIPWQEPDALTWKNFRARPVASHSAHALTTYEVLLEFRYDEAGNLQFDVSCVFLEKESWVKKNPTDVLLKHEQGHFDLAEITARKLRRKLAETKLPADPKALNKKVKQIYNDVLNAGEAVQRAYDKETDHSRQLEAQKAWDARIAQELKELEAWFVAPD